MIMLLDEYYKDVCAILQYEHQVHELPDAIVVNIAFTQGLSAKETAKLIAET